MDEPVKVGQTWVRWSGRHQGARVVVEYENEVNRELLGDRRFWVVRSLTDKQGAWREIEQAILVSDWRLLEAHTGTAPSGENESSRETP